MSTVSCFAVRATIGAISRQIHGGWTSKCNILIFELTIICRTLINITKVTEFIQLPCEFYKCANEDFLYPYFLTFIRKKIMAFIKPEGDIFPHSSPSVSSDNDTIKSSKRCHHWNLCQVNVAINRHQTSNARVVVIQLTIVLDHLLFYTLAPFHNISTHHYPWAPVAPWKSCHDPGAFIAERYRPNFYPLFMSYRTWLVMSSSFFYFMWFTHKYWHNESSCHLKVSNLKFQTVHCWGKIAKARIFRKKVWKWKYENVEVKVWTGESENM